MEHEIFSGQHILIEYKNYNEQEATNLQYITYTYFALDPQFEMLSLLVSGVKKTPIHCDTVYLVFYDCPWSI